MKAVILAAGKGTRMWPLTQETPKPLLPVAGKPVIDHNIELLEDHVDEFIVVGGYEINTLRDHFSSRKDVEVVRQKQAKGTADAALTAKKHIDGKAVILNGDDIYPEEALEAIKQDKAVLGSRVEDPENYGVFTEEDGKAIDITEKPSEPESNLVNTGMYVVDEEFFDLLEEVRLSERGEYEITDAVENYLQNNDVELVTTESWMPCSYPWQLIDANEKLMADIEHIVEGKVHGSVSIHGNVIIEKGAKIRENSVIEGPVIIKSGAEVGPNAHIRPNTVLHENVKVGRSEIKNSVMLEGSSAPHFNYVGDSYIGRETNFGAGSKTANLRNDDQNVKTMVKGELLYTGRHKFGTVTGDHAKIGVNCSIKPGRKIGYKAGTDSHEKVGEDVPDEQVLKDGELV